MTDEPDSEVPVRARRSRQYSAKYKLRILGEYEQLDKAGKGALLRREGLYTSLISEWRKQRDRGTREALGRPRGRTSADPAGRETDAVDAEAAARKVLCGRRPDPRVIRQDDPASAQSRRRPRRQPCAAHDRRGPAALLRPHARRRRPPPRRGQDQQEILRCLKRYIARQVYRTLRADLRAQPT